MALTILYTFLIAMVPVIELRGAIPFGAGAGLTPALSAVVSAIGNFIPIPFLLIFVPKLFDWLRDKKLTKKFVAWLENKAKKNHKTIEKYGYIGLIILVAIPLPGTGAWTGALVASCFEMDFKKSILAITTGILVAAAIVFAITCGIIQII